MKRLAASHDDIIVGGALLQPRRQFQGRAQPTADTVALDGAANLACYRQSNAGDRDGFVGDCSGGGLKGEATSVSAKPLGDALELSAFGQAGEAPAIAPVGGRAGSVWTSH